MFKKVLLSFLLLLLLCTSALAQAEPAQDITADCKVTVVGGYDPKNLFDRQYTSFWRGREMKNSYVQFTTPEGVEAEYLYICFGEMPGSWAIEEEIDGEWKTLIEGTYDYYHVLLELGGKTNFRLIDTTNKTTQFKINEMFVFSAGELPDWVQRWEPTVEKADLLVLATHPDDELIFFGGTIPTYDTERGLQVVVAYMSYSNTTRRSELLNGLWHMGVRHYPVIGEFHDSYSGKLEDAYKRWKKNDARAYVTELIRKYKPEVMLTHDVNGEYGHGAHKLTADVAQYCVAHANDETFLPDLAAEYGTWEVKKLYLHLSKENSIIMDWRQPLASLNGKTGLEIAQEAYELHVTQATTKFVVTDEGETSCAEFGLVHTTVGEDVIGGDLMENIRTAPTPRPDGTTSEPTASPTPMPEPTATPIPTPTPESDKPYADVDWPAEAAGQRKDESGYLLEGEYVYQNEDEGLWFYASPTLVVRIDRLFDAEKVVTWYEADIFCDLNTESFGSILYDPEHPQKKHVQAAVIARENQVVFGMNTDYYTYRLGRNTITGMVIRDGEVFFKRVPEADRGQFPNLDTLAMFEDGSWGVYKSDELTSEEYLAMGAVDVYSFGPYLVRDGEINPFVIKMKNGKTDQPRCAVGMVEPGHYYALLAEGRIRNVSVGVNIEFLANNMLEAGCKVAFNLDGGQTAVMTFMGDQVSRIGKYSGGRTSARATTEIMGIGHSDLIDPEQKPYYPNAYQ